MHIKNEIDSLYKLKMSKFNRSSFIYNIKWSSILRNHFIFSRESKYSIIPDNRPALS